MKQKSVNEGLKKDLLKILLEVYMNDEYVLSGRHMDHLVIVIPLFSPQWIDCRPDSSAPEFTVDES